MTEQDEKPKSERKGVRSVTLSLPDQIYMELLIKIRHENLNWKRFFNFMIDGFLKDDPGIMEYIDYQMADIRAKKRTKVLQKERKDVKTTIDVFGLDENEIQDIYDILEDEIEP